MLDEEDDPLTTPEQMFVEEMLELLSNVCLQSPLIQFVLKLGCNPQDSETISCLFWSSCDLLHGMKSPSEEMNECKYTRNAKYLVLSHCSNIDY